MNYEAAESMLKNRPSRTLPGKETHLIRLDPDRIALRLYYTNILIWTRANMDTGANETITLDAGNWHTKLTKDRLNVYLTHWRVYQNRYSWYLWKPPDEDTAIPWENSIELIDRY